MSARACAEWGTGASRFGARAALLGLCLSVWAMSGAAADAERDGPGAAAQAPEVTSDRTEDTLELHETAGTEPEPDVPAQGAAEAEPGEAEERAPRGLFTRIVEWFRSERAPPDAEAQAADTTPAGEPVTHRHVLQAIHDLTAEVALLRRATSVTTAPPAAAPREGLAPVHVCAKALEVLEKTARVQRRLGMIPVEAGHLSGAAPQDLLRAVGDIVAELRRIKRQLVVEEAIEPAPPTAGAVTPTALYEALARASFLLDGLVGRPATLNDVRVRVAWVHREMDPIAARLDAALAAGPPPGAPSDRAPAEVAQQLLRATYKAITLQTALGMEASGVPDAALARADPAEALDAGNMLLAEVVRVRDHLGVAPAQHGEPGDEPPADVFTLALATVSHLDAMIRAARNAP